MSMSAYSTSSFDAALANKAQIQIYLSDLNHISAWLTKNVRDLLEGHGKIPPGDVVKHIYYTLRLLLASDKTLQYPAATLQDLERTWSTRSYPVAGIGQWLEPIIHLSPLYKDIITRIQFGATVMEIGGFLGIDLRKMNADGLGILTATNLYVVDVASHCQAGHFLFRDRDRFPINFIEADIRDPCIKLVAQRRKIDVVIANLVLHQWNYEGQRAACVQMARLTRGPGSMVLGVQVGAIREIGLWQGLGGVYGDLQTPGSFERMWGEVGRLTGTSWKVEATLCDMTALGWREEDVRDLGRDCRLLQWVARRQP